jgi:hypothetical protein
MKKTYLPPVARIIIVRCSFHLIQGSGMQNQHIVNSFNQGERITLGGGDEGGVSSSRPTPVYTFHSLWDYDD